MFFFRILNLFFLIASPYLFSEEYDPISVYLTWTRSPESTITIAWISGTSEIDDLVYYQSLNTQDEGSCRPFLQKTAAHIKMPQGNPYLIHRVELTDLEPETPYIFKISANGRLFKFKTMPKSLTKVKFVEGGDMYHDEIYHVAKTNSEAAALNPQFAVIGGDIAYAADSSHGIFPENVYRWLKWLVTWKNTMVTTDGFLIPILPAIGNHETAGGYKKTPTAAPFFYALFAMPGKQGYNVLDFGNYMSLILLDSGHTHPVSNSQTDWLLETLQSRAHIPYKFAVYHVPAYPSVRPFTYELSAVIRKHWVPLFDTFFLKAAFEHHDHAYKRTFPLKGGKKHERGVIYLGDGAWGVAKPRKARQKIIPYIEKHLQTRNFILVTLDNACVTYEVYNDKGEMIDRAIQNK